MTRTAHAASRANAARIADDLLAKRAAQFRERETELHRLVTDYHHATAQARKIRADAQAHAAKIAADAETRITALRGRTDKQASEFEDTAKTAVRALLQFGESRTVVAGLTGLTAAQVHAIERTASSTAPPRRGTPLASRQPDDHGTPPAETAR